MGGYPTAVGTPNHSGTYIPLVYYTTALLVAFYQATVFAAISNTEYEGSIKEVGDTLRIRTLPDISIRDYVKGQNLTYETPEGGYLDLVIDQGKYWAMSLNDVDTKQMDINRATKWAQHAAEYMKIEIDTDILAGVYGSVHAKNTGSSAGVKSGAFSLGVTGTPIALTADTILDYIVDTGTVLDEQNVPDSGRFFVIPAWAAGLIKKSDLKDASMTGDGTSLLRNGRLGMIDRYELFMSNNLATYTADSATHAIFGQKTAIAFASQMIKTETLPNPNDFGQLMRSLQVYGYKVVKPEALGHAYISKSA